MSFQSKALSWISVAVFVGSVSVSRCLGDDTLVSIMKDAIAEKIASTNGAGDRPTIIVINPINALEGFYPAIKIDSARILQLENTATTQIFALLDSQPIFASPAKEDARNPKLSAHPSPPVASPPASSSRSSNTQDSTLADIASQASATASPSPVTSQSKPLTPYPKVSGWSQRSGWFTYQRTPVRLTIGAMGEAQPADYELSFSMKLVPTEIKPTHADVGEPASRSINIVLVENIYLSGTIPLPNHSLDLLNGERVENGFFAGFPLFVKPATAADGTRQPLLVRNADGVFISGPLIFGITNN